MTIRFYPADKNLRIGITMRDELAPEQGNMALHVCKNAREVLDNRKRFVSSIGCRLSDLVCSNQTHSSNCYKVTAADRGRGSDAAISAIPDTDALYTREVGLVLACFSADCVPLAFYSGVDGLIGTIHSGHRGTCGEITRQVFRQIKLEEKVNLEDLFVVIGPSLSQRRFQVDADVFGAFKALGYADAFIHLDLATGKYHIDNQKVVETQCLLEGILPDRIYVDSTCTYDDPAGFSYRQDKESGRHMMFILQNPSFD